MAITPVEFGKFMKKHRRAKHTTQKVLAEQIGVQTKSISYIERGKNYPSTDKLFKIATFLGMSLDEFIYDTTQFNSQISISELNDILATMPERNHPMFLKIVKAAAEEINKI